MKEGPFYMAEPFPKDEFLGEGSLIQIGGDDHFEILRVMAISEDGKTISFYPACVAFGPPLTFPASTKAP